MSPRDRRHKDTSISLHPLSFDEAMAKLARSRRGDSQAEESGSTTEPDPPAGRWTGFPPAYRQACPTL